MVRLSATAKVCLKCHQAGDHPIVDFYGAKLFSTGGGLVPDEAQQDQWVKHWWHKTKQTREIYYRVAEQTHHPTKPTTQLDQFYWVLKEILQNYSPVPVFFELINPSALRVRQDAVKVFDIVSPIASSNNEAKTMDKKNVDNAEKPSTLVTNEQVNKTEEHE